MGDKSSEDIVSLVNLINFIEDQKSKRKALVTFKRSAIFYDILSGKSAEEICRNNNIKTSNSDKLISKYWSRLFKYANITHKPHIRRVKYLIREFMYDNDTPKDQKVAESP